MEQEYLLDENSFLVSETDEKGIITFANNDFCQMAGYTVQEMIGRPHNIVRHPDMPKAAFQELWHTIKEGRTWTGFVKNARHGGGFYWVYATIFPMVGCNGKKGYISCRRIARKDEIQRAEALYKTLV